MSREVDGACKQPMANDGFLAMLLFYCFVGDRLANTHSLQESAREDRAAEQRSSWCHHTAKVWFIPFFASYCLIWSHSHTTHTRPLISYLMEWASRENQKQQQCFICTQSVLGCQGRWWESGAEPVSNVSGVCFQLMQFYVSSLLWYMKNGK